MPKNRISGYFPTAFEPARTPRRTVRLATVPKSGFVALPRPMVSSPPPGHVTSQADLYQLARDAAIAEIHERLLALLHQRRGLLGQDRDA